MRVPFGSGFPISLFTLGTMRAINNAKQMKEVLEAAVEAGINHIETAPNYGPAEQFIGQAIELSTNQPNGGWVITSKLLPGIDFNQGRCQLEAIIKRLGRDRLDNLAIHGLNLPEHLHWALTGEGKRLINWALKKGLVTQVGFSSHGNNELISSALDSKFFSFCSLHLHLLDPQRMPLARQALAQGMGVMAISPADKGGRLQAPSSTLIDDCKPFSPLELAYRYLLAEGISTLTIGASKATDLQLAKKLSKANKQLTVSEKTALIQLKTRQKERLGSNHCGQCRRCIPCPKEVPIPELLRLRNLSLGHDLTSFSEERYNLIGKAGHWWEKTDASACENCRECISRCPNKLPIPELLIDTHRRLKSKSRRRLWS